MTERDERALREALRGLETADSVDPAAARRGAAERRRNRQTLAGIATVLVLVAGVAGLPGLLSGRGVEATSAGQAGAGAETEAEGGAEAGGDQAPAGEPRAQDRSEERRLEPQAGPVPSGWRTEYYRDISFQVPASWGYAVPPRDAWCASNRDGKPRADQRRPYVWLATDVPTALIGCPEPRPASLLTEHVEALSPGPASDYAEGTVREGDWWSVTRFAGSAVLVVTTKDRDLAERILDSAHIAPEDAPCSPRSPVAGPVGARPPDGIDLRLLPPVDRVVLCQYEPAADPVDADLPRLRAALPLDQPSGRALVQAMAAAPVNDTRCVGPDIARPALAVVVRIESGGRNYAVHVHSVGCVDGTAGMDGGIDDGTTVRTLTKDACRQLLTPPLAIFTASGDLGRNCLR